MNLQSLAERLEAQGVGVRGSTIFVNSMPQSVSLGVLLREPYNGTPIDHELPGFRRGRFQLIVRSKDHSFGATKMAAAVAALSVEEVALTDMSVRFIRPLHEAVSYPISDGNNHEFSVNFDAAYVIV